MPTYVRRYLHLCALICVLGALLHLALPLLGPNAYALAGAPPGLVQMAAAGQAYPVIVCIVIAGLLCAFAAYALSASGNWRRLPALRPVLALVGGVLFLRGIGFVPLLFLRQDLLQRICDCRSVDTFLITTSLLCLALGIGFLLGAWHSPSAPSRQSGARR